MKNWSSATVVEWKAGGAGSGGRSGGTSPDKHSEMADRWRHEG